MTQDEIIEMALKVDLMGHELAYSDWYKNRLKAFGKLIAEKEREACAKLCDDRVIAYQYATDVWAQEHIDEARHLANAIRARGQA